MKKHKTAKYNRFSVFDAVNYLIMFLMMAAIIVPFVHIISISFSESSYVLRNEVGLWPKGFTFQTYIDVFKTGDFITAYKNTITYTVVYTVLALMTTAMAAYALSRRKIVGQKVFSLMITITMFFGGGLIPTYLVVKTLGLVGSMWAIILPSMISTFNLIIMRSFFIAYPQEIIESGQLDGLQEAGVFFRLVLPTSKAALATIALYYAVAQWNTYLPALIYDLPADKYPLQYYLSTLMASYEKNASGAEGNLTPATVQYASIMIATLPIMCVYPFIQKYFVKGVMVGSIKG